MLFPRLRTPHDSAARQRSRAEFLIHLQGRAGLEIWTPSLADLRLGIAPLAEAARAAGVELLATNLRPAGAQPTVFQPKLLRQVGGLRVGLIGLVGSRSGPPNGWIVDEPAASARRALAELIPQADLIVALSNLGIEADRCLAEQVPGIHVILGAGDDRMILVPRRVADSLILQPYKQGEYLGLLRLKLSDPILPLFDALEQARLERELSKAHAEGTIQLRERLREFQGRSSYRAMLRPLADDLPDVAEIAEAVRNQLAREQQIPK
jgi:2',3'-cyclic-nucleotide 2'-phosphodiesterase (5'-nucleotidase family)